MSFLAQQMQTPVLEAANIVFLRSKAEQTLFFTPQTPFF